MSDEYKKAREAYRQRVALEKQIESNVAIAEQLGAQEPMQQQPVPLAPRPKDSPFFAGLKRGAGLGPLTGESDKELAQKAGDSLPGFLGEAVGNAAGPLAAGVVGAKTGFALGGPYGAAGGLLLGAGLGAYPSAVGRRMQSGETASQAGSNAVGDAATEAALTGAFGAGAAAVKSGLRLSGAFLKSVTRGRWVAESGEEAAKYATKTYGKKAAEVMAENQVRTFANPLIDAQNVALAEKKVANQLGELYEISKSVRTPVDGFQKSWSEAFKSSQPLRQSDKEALSKIEKQLRKNLFTSDPAIEGGKPFVSVKVIQDARTALKLYAENNPQAGPAVKEMREKLLKMYVERLPNSPEMPLKAMHQKLHKAKRDLSRVKKDLSGISSQ